MYQPDSTCVQRWFAELTGYETCTECKGLIVDVGSSANSSDHPQSPPSPNSFHSPTSESRILDQDCELPQEPPHDHISNDTAPTTESTHCLNCSNHQIHPSQQIPAKSCVIPYKGEGARHQQSNTRMTTRGLRNFYPGFILPAPGPCSACRRVEGPHPTKCPGCNHKYRLQLAENPEPPRGYIGKRPPFGLAGWRVARGHRKPKPVTLHAYGCYMQRRQNCYGGAHAKEFTHLGQPPSVLVNFKGCPRM